MSNVKTWQWLVVWCALVLMYATGYARGRFVQRRWDGVYEKYIQWRQRDAEARAGWRD